MRYEAEEGKCFKIKGIENGYLDTVLYLGNGDSIDNYEQVNLVERETWEQEQDKKQKEAQLAALMQELYPEQAPNMLSGLKEEQ